MISKPLAGALVNTADPLARGLIGAWLLNEGGGSRANNSASYKANAAAAGTSGFRLTGFDATLPGSQWAAVPAGIWTPQKTSPFSILVRVRYTQASNGTMFGLGYPSAGGIILRTQSTAGPYTAGQILFVVSNSSGANAIACSSSRSLNDNRWHNVLALYDGSVTSAGLALVIDGSVAALSTQGPGGTGDPGTLGNVGFRFGARMDGGETFTGSMGTVMLWDRALTLAEAKDATVNPWRMFEPTSQRRRTYIAARTGKVRVKVGGTFSAKPVAVKIGGVFVTKPVKVKVAGSFLLTN